MRPRRSPRWRSGLGIGLGIVLAIAGGARAADEDALLSQGRMLFAARGCSGCHMVGGVGGTAAPDLTKIGARLGGPAEAAAWLRDPALHKQPVHTQLTHSLGSDEVTALAAFLASLR
jgi:cytochrome c oxidase subunit 2